MRFLVCGVANVETTCRVPGFPLAYAPVHYPFHGVRSTVSGVAVNVASALRALGHEVRLLAMVGRDPLGAWVRQALAARGLDDRWVLPLLEETPQSVVLYDGEGRRQIHVDLKDAQRTAYPEARFDEALAGAAVAVLCNAEPCRPLVGRARAAGALVATDVHCVSDLHDAYNADFMRGAQVLFLSDEHLADPRAFVERAAAEHGNDVVVCGRGAQGALLCARGDGVIHLPAAHPRPVVNTVGAGDALFAAFLHGHARGDRPGEALRRAICFAGWKIGATGAAEGFLSAAELDALAGPAHA